MNKKTFVPLLVLALATPFYVALADDASTTTSDSTSSSTTTTTTDCGSAPTAPTALGSGATPQERQQYKQEFQEYRQGLQKYNQCRKNQIKEERQEQKEQKTQEHCDLITQKINTRIDNYSNNHNADRTVFGNIYQRLTNLITRLNARGLDTTTLSNDLATLKTKIDKVATDYAAFVEALKATENYTCGKSQGQFISQLASAKKIILTVRQDRLDVKNYINNTIKPDIKALRKQLEQKEEVLEETSSSNTETNTTTSSSSSTTETVQ